MNIEMILVSNTDPEPGEGMTEMEEAKMGLNYGQKNKGGSSSNRKENRMNLDLTNVKGFICWHEWGTHFLSLFNLVVLLQGSKCEPWADAATKHRR